MAKYIGKRLVTGILSLFVLATVTFFLTRAIPGSPFQGANVSESVLQMMEEEYGLHQPAGVQYVTYMKHLLRGNLGYSYQNPSESVANIIQRSWPVTAVIGVLAILLAMIVGIGIGVWQTFSRHRLLRGGLFTGTLLIGGVPNFVAALLLMLVFGVWLKWLPVSGLDSWKNYILPVCALALYPACSLARLTGTLLAQEKQRDYVLLARTKGLKKKTDLVYAHSAAYLDSGAELSGTCKCVSFDRKFCGGEHFYHSGAWKTVCKFHCEPGLYTHSWADNLYGGSRDPDSAGSGLT